MKIGGIQVDDTEVRKCVETILDFNNSREAFRCEEPSVPAI